MLLNANGLGYFELPNPNILYVEINHICNQRALLQRKIKASAYGKRKFRCHGQGSKQSL